MGNKGRLPYEPASLRELQARYSDAVADVCDLMAIEMGLEDPPGLQRKHVFDFEDGLRLIVSREKAPGEPVVIHFSGSPEANSVRLWVERRIGWSGIQSAQEWFAGYVEPRYRALSGWQGLVNFGGFSSGRGLPHWWHRDNTQPNVG